ncbi:molecular chaperone DnaJ [Candidatus Wolfebacteria bacterium]|nr:MAG: molecular chaperone DnaJ [Candidatus Wolfebacteria bacterium]
MSKDYYQILGVSKESTKDQIKKAFHKLAHKYHPDKKGGNEAKFKEVNEAYQVLSDERKRSEYDSYGRVFSGAGGGGAGYSDFSQAQQAGFDFGNLNDIFSQFFTGGMAGAQRAPRGRDISTELHISFEESIFGIERKILVNKMSECKICENTGGKPGTKMETCTRCNGQGQVHETKQSMLGTFSSVRICETCVGSGKVPHEKCVSCKGAGILKDQHEINVAIPAGIQNGEMIRLLGFGEAVSKGTSGDLYIKINVAPHATFKRNGLNLTMDLNIKLSDALLGTTYTIATLDGDIELPIPVGVSAHEVLRVAGKGVPKGSGQRGDLLVKINISLPKKLTNKSKELIEELKKEGV